MENASSVPCYFDFLPISKEDMTRRSWYWYDFLVVTGDAYVDHPSFGTSVISRVLESEGFRVAVLPQPYWRGPRDFAAMGRPRLGVFIGSGNLDSMVAHYTAAKKRRKEDFYSPGKKPGLRPDRAVIVYSNLAREAFGGELPVIIGGLEASLRRFAHYDYWDDRVRRGILFDSKADILVYGMGESASREIARRLKAGIPASKITDIPGTCFIAHSPDDCAFPALELPCFERAANDKISYARAARLELEEHDPVRGRALIQAHENRYLIANPPAMPLSKEALDAVFELPYTREYHPMYEKDGGVPAIEEVRFSVIHNRGCFGSCNFCSLGFHQGRIVTSRSHGSVIREAGKMTAHPEFKGFISDVGGPTANFRRSSCREQLVRGVCRDKRCLTPRACARLDADHSDYLSLLRKLRVIPGVKKVFIRSGVRFDYMLLDASGEFFAELVRHHVSGQLKVAPEHCVDRVLELMGKPRFDCYERFLEKYKRLNKRYGMQQYVVPYLMSSHPGSTLNDAVTLAEYLNKIGRIPEQVQDFYPTPGTISTCMYHTGLDPFTMKAVHVPKDSREKAMQRALLQWRLPENRRLVEEALKLASREDLIGYSKRCLIRPYTRQGSGKYEQKNRRGTKNAKQCASRTRKERGHGKSATI